MQYYTTATEADTHSHVHTYLWLRSYKVIHSPPSAIVTVQTGKSVFLQSKFIQKHKNIYCSIDNYVTYSSLSGRHATSHIFCLIIVLIILCVDAIIVALRIFKHSIMWANTDTSEQMQLSKPRQG